MTNYRNEQTIELGKIFLETGTTSKVEYVRVVS